MTSPDIFVKALQSTTLADFCALAFGALGVPEYEERESSNYVEGHYFCSVGQNPEIEICYVDDEELSEYRFWVSFSSSDVVTETCAQRGARALSELGHDCFVPSRGWARKGWDGRGTHFTA